MLFAMEKRFFFGNYLIWVILLLGQLHGCKSCIEKERKALLELKKYFIPMSEEDFVLSSWTNDTKSDCCGWERVECNRTSGRVIEIAFNTLYLQDFPLINLSLLYPFEELRSLNFSDNYFNGFFDDSEGYKSFGKLKKLEILDLSDNHFNSSIFPFLSAATSLKHLSLRDNLIEGSIPSKVYKSLRKLKNLEILDLSQNKFNNNIFLFLNAATSLKSLCLRYSLIDGSIPSKALKNLKNLEILDLSINSLVSIPDLTHLRKLKSLDLRINDIPFLMELQVYKSLRKLKKLEILDLSHNKFNSSIFFFLNAITSLKSLSLVSNYMGGSFPAKALKNLINLELLDLSGNMLNGSMPDFTHLRKLKSLDLSYNSFSSSMDLQGYKGLRKLKNLEILDLSWNNFNSSIFHFLNTATSLKSLSLWGNNMEGSIPIEPLKDLINLELLNLNGNMVNVSMAVDFTHLRKLKSLDLSSNSFSSSLELQEIKDLTNLEDLKLSKNKLNGSMSVFTHLKKLKALDLSFNDYSSAMELQDLKDLINLELLNLEGNRFNGSMSVFCEIKNLQKLNLKGNKVAGQLPLCLGRWKGLRVLDLSDNQFSGDLPSSFSSLESLEYLSLLDNNFASLMSLNPLTNLTKLKVFKLSSTSEMVQVDVESILQPKFQLSVFVLRSCNLEKIPSFLIYQKRLHLVDLSNNKLSKIIPTWFLANNPKLECLRLQNNLFTIFLMPSLLHHNLNVLDFSANDIGGIFPDNVGRGLPKMALMNMSSNRFQGSFSLCEMKAIELIDISYNNFSGKLPRSFFKDCSSLTYLKLSHNKFTGNFPLTGIYNTYLVMLSINDNFFTGKIGVELLTAQVLSILDISNNFFTGEIPSWISNISLSYLDLSGNLLSGVLPSRVSNYLGEQKVKVFLHDNNIIGPIPDTFLENVEILNLRNNKLSGSVPRFVNTQSINILLLRGNNFTGSIPRQLCDLENIRLLDLSDNKFNGSIPTCLHNLSFGSRGEEKMSGYYSIGSKFLSTHVYLYETTLVVEELVINYSIFQEIEIKFAVKQRYESYSGMSSFSNGLLCYMYGMDLSNNKLSGIIPEELGDLSKLLTLNLSRNLLSGSIPSSFSNLKDIESLDLSYNMLHGSIPQQLTSLTSLAVFDVSNNNLSGIIPQGKQFNTFIENNYLGNPLLCGLPTNRTCEAMKRSKEEDNSVGEDKDDEASFDMLVFYYSSASTYATVFIGILVLMCIDCPWRRAWFRVIDAFIASVKSMLF